MAHVLWKLLLLLTSTLAIPLTSTSQSLNLAPLDITPVQQLNISSPGTEIGYFKQTRIPPFLETNGRDCESALDRWVAGQSLSKPRIFGRNPTSGGATVLLPFQVVFRTCVIYMNMVEDDEEDALSLAEIYAEGLGPKGVIKNCLGQRRLPAIGERMVPGPKGLLRLCGRGYAAWSG